MKEIIAHYVQQLGSTEFDQAYHALIEVDDSLVPELINAYEIDPKLKVRKALIEIIGEHRRVEDVEFLGQILHSENSNLWKAALDALVKINHQICIHTLLEANEAIQIIESDSDKLDWINEAIQQLREQQVD